MLDYLEVSKIRSVEEIENYLKRKQGYYKKFRRVYFKLEDKYTKNAGFYNVGEAEAQNGYLCEYDPMLRAYLFSTQGPVYTRQEAAQKIYNIILRDYQ